MTSPALTAYTFLPWVQGGVAPLDRRRGRAHDHAARARDAARVGAPGSRRRRAGVGAPVRAGRRHGRERRADRPPRPGAGHHPLRDRLHAPGPVRARGPAVAVHTRRAGHDEDAAATVARSRGGPARRRGPPAARQPLPVLELDDPAGELPDLAQSWAWAHAQITGLPAGARPRRCPRRRPGPGVLAARSAPQARARHRVPGLPGARVRRRRPGRPRAARARRREAGPGLGRDAHRPAAAAGLRLLGIRHGARGELRDAGPASCTRHRSTPPRRARRTWTWARPAAACRPAG